MKLSSFSSSQFKCRLGISYTPLIFTEHSLQRRKEYSGKEKIKVWIALSKVDKWTWRLTRSQNILNKNFFYDFHKGINYFKQEFQNVNFTNSFLVKFLFERTTELKRICITRKLLVFCSFINETARMWRQKTKWSYYHWIRVWV